MAEKSKEGHLPLTGVVVLDLTLARAGPTCVRHLADSKDEVEQLRAAGVTEAPASKAA